MAFVVTNTSIPSLFLTVAIFPLLLRFIFYALLESEIERKEWAMEGDNE